MELPHIWDNPGEIGCFPDVPMHLLFINVQKSSFNLVLKCYSFFNSNRTK